MLNNFTSFDKWLWLLLLNIGGGTSATTLTVTGNPIHILDALAKPAQALSVKLEPIQDLNGYDNPWPAGGGKNKLPYPYFSSDGSYGGVQFSTDPVGKITASGQNTSGINYYLAQSFALKAGTYTVSIRGAHDGAVFYIYDQDNTQTVASIQPSASDGSATFTLNADAENLRVYFNRGSTGYTININCYVQIESGSTATAWSPYSNLCPISGHTDADVIVSPTLNPADGTTYPIPLGQTVYGGTLDVLTGVLTVTRGKLLLDGNLSQGSINIEINNDMTRVTYIPFNNVGKPQTGFVSDTLKDNGTYWAVYGIWRSSVLTAARMFIGLPATVTTKEEAIAWFAANPTQVVYELATPITIQLTPTQVELLQGENNLFSDGEMTLTYLADGNASDEEALNILLGGRYVNNHGEDEPTDREALNIILGGNER